MNFIKDILACVIPLICILTMRDPSMDLLILLKDVIMCNKKLVKAFDSQSKIWWQTLWLEFGNECRSGARTFTGAGSTNQTRRGMEGW